MRSLLFFLCLLLTMISCSSSHDPNKSDRADSVVDTIKKSDTVIVAQKCEFDLRKFKRSIDSLLASIDHKPDTFRLTTDTFSFTLSSYEQLAGSYSPSS